MPRVKIRFQQVGDAKRFYEILTHPDFIYFPVNPPSIEAERGFLRQNAAKRKAGTEFNFAILYRGRLIGAVGIGVDSKRSHVAEIGYFLDQKYWGRGFMVEAVSLAEKWAVENLNIHRLELLTIKENKASQRVALKCGYRKEGIQRGKIAFEGEYRDALIYAKIFG